MNVIHIHQAEIIAFDDREYLAAIETQTVEDGGGMQAYVILMDHDEKVKLVLGSVYSKTVDIPKVHQECIDLIMDEDYCNSVWEHNKVIN